VAGVPHSRQIANRDPSVRVVSVHFALRLAIPADTAAIRTLIDLSVRGLQATDYTPSQIEGALKSVYGTDSQLIVDGTYFVIEAEPDPADPSVARILVGCGGWSKRSTLFGGDQYVGRRDGLLDPGRDAAKIRAFFVHPAWARRGIGSRILDACEHAARAAGFSRFEMGATLTGVPFYLARGYAMLDRIAVPLPGDESLAIVRMQKEVT
jgi:GNAT superfamily N-acetyltransferase